MHHTYPLLIRIFIWLCLCSATTPVIAAWFSATGQAVVQNGDRNAARKAATEEAIKQALLFAGASVRSVQQMTNGLLMSEHLEIRANGEVNSIELIDEIYEDNIVSVRIRADIFAQETQCRAADYTKKMSTTYFPIQYLAQASDGQIHDIGKASALKLQELTNKLSPHLELSTVEPFVFNWHKQNATDQANALATQSNTQFVIALVLNDISVNRYPPERFNLFKRAQNVRNFNYTISLINGANGETVFSRQYQTSASWDYEFTEDVDVTSQSFWRSEYGKHIEKSLARSIGEIEDVAVCLPTMGRVLAVANNQVQINLGRSHQVRVGDEMTLFNIQNVTDTFGQNFQQFVLHPSSLIVREVYNSTATLETIDNSLLGSVQPNDYVARQ